MATGQNKTNPDEEVDDVARFSNPRIKANGILPSSFRGRRNEQPADAVR
jgi:hypothetical protein